MQPQFSAPPVKWNAQPAPAEPPLRIDDNGAPVFPEWGDGPSATETPQPEPLVSQRAGEVVVVSDEEADAFTQQAYGKTANEMADEAEAGYDPAKMVQRTPEIETVDAEIVDEPVKKPRKKRAPKKTAARKVSADLAKIDDVSDEQLMADYGVEQIFSTTDTAEFFDRTNQWLYWGLREGVFTHEDGSKVDPERIGDPERGRRRFTLPIIEDILKSSYHRGNIEPDELKVILRRIHIAKLGGEWREKEGWKQVELGKRKVRWVKSERAVWDEGEQRYKLRPEFQVKPDGEIVAAK